jgi:hypothetical protein
MALIPIQSTAPSMRSFHNVLFKECHKECGTETSGGMTVSQCWTVCTTQTTKKGGVSRTDPNNAATRSGSTGPTKPTPPKTGGTSKHQ